MRPPFLNPWKVFRDTVSVNANLVTIFLNVLLHKISKLNELELLSTILKGVVSKVLF